MEKRKRALDRLIFYFFMLIAYVLQYYWNCNIGRVPLNYIDATCFIATALNFEYLIYQSYKGVVMWLTFITKLLFWVAFFIMISNMIALVGELLICYILWKGQLSRKPKKLLH